MRYTQAIGYARYSSKGQEGNTSIDRQKSQIEAWCEQVKIPLLTEIIQDDGISAFHADNVLSGNLGKIIATAEKGLYPKNTILVVENLDRLSRGDLLEAQMLIQRIFKAGLAVRALSQSKTYSFDNNGLTNVILQLTTFERAHEESKIKSNRVIASYAARYEAAKGGGKLITSICPSWVKFDTETGRAKIVESRKEQIIEMVDYYLNNDVGVDKLSRIINHEWKWKPWKHSNQANKSGLWSKSYVGRILRNPALIGHFQYRVKPVTKTEDNENLSFWKYADQSQVVDGKWKFGEVIKDYFDPVLDEETYYRLQRKLTKNGAQKKGVSSNGSNRNLFSGLIICSCGGKMHYMGKGRTYSYLICSSKCGVPTIRYESFEEHILDTVPLDNTDDIKLQNAKIERENDAILGEVEVEEKYMNDLEATMKHTRSSRLMSQLAQAESAVEELKKSIKPPLELPTAKDQWLLTLANIDDDQWRNGVKATLRETLTKITVTSVGKGYHTDIIMKTEKRYWGYFETARKPKSASEWFFGHYLKSNHSEVFDPKYEGKMKDWVELITLKFL